MTDQFVRGWPTRRSIAAAVVDDFGREWQSFDQAGFDESERKQHVDAYFAVFPSERIAADAVGFDARAGLEHVRFSSATPFWCAVGFKK